MGFFDDLESALDGFENLVNHAADSLERGAAAVEKSVDTAEQHLNQGADLIDRHSRTIADKAERVVATSEKLAAQKPRGLNVPVRFDSSDNSTVN